MSFTEDLAERAVCIRFDDLPEDDYRRNANGDQAS